MYALIIVICMCVIVLNVQYNKKATKTFNELKQNAKSKSKLKFL